MLLGGIVHFLVLQLRQGTTDAEACVARLYDVVNIAVLGCLIGIGEEILILLYLVVKELLCLVGLTLVLERLRLLGIQHGGCTAGSHDGYLGRGPCIVGITAQLLMDNGIAVCGETAIPCSAEL